MAHLRFTDVQDHPTEFLDFTSLTRDEGDVSKMLMCYSL
jgi:hypothetical protein